MPPEPPPGFAEDPSFSDTGRTLPGATGTGSGLTFSGPWVPPSAEALQELLPQYEITRLLGRGGMGAVYMGRQIALDRPVAIKILSGALEETDRGFTERFKNEARAMARLNHPHIVALYDFGHTSTGLLYIVMEFIEGTDVQKMMDTGGRLPPRHALVIAAHVCDALAFAHEQGIIHRDIKPANVMVSRDGVVKVADFGLAKVIQGGGTQSTGLTQSGTAMGTLHYMAPEALVLGSAVDHRADLYAVGVMLYHLLTGRLPQGMFAMPSRQIEGLDPRIDEVVARSLSEDRDLRYQSALEMRASIRAILTKPAATKTESPHAEPPAAKPEPESGPEPGQVPGHLLYRPPSPACPRPPRLRARQPAHPSGRPQRRAALFENGTLTVWGQVHDGISAPGNAEWRTTPAVPPGRKAAAMSNMPASMALSLDNGEILCWGSNAGQRRMPKGDYVDFSINHYGVHAIPRNAGPTITWRRSRMLCARVKGTDLAHSFR